MREQVEEVLELQSDWTWQNTPAMERRGILIRSTAAQWLRDQLPVLQGVVPSTVDDLRIEGRDGTGRKTEVPWIRIYSESRSSSATLGFYVVYLFSASGRHVYLSINQGTTRWENGEFRPRPDHELAERVAWARDVVAPELAERSDILTDIDLEATKALGRGYELGNIAAFRYTAGEVPPADALAEDLQFMVRALGGIYQATDSALDLPGEPAPEVADTVAIVEQVARPRPRPRAARNMIRLSAAERTAIERHAVSVTTAHLKGLGYKVKDVGATQSYDLDARRGTEHLYVEVKGTTSEGAEVILTRNEVELNAKRYPATMLALVTNIELDRTEGSPSASGGKLVTFHPWRVDPKALQPLAYRYGVPEQG
jgi:hypothetical protein